MKKIKPIKDLINIIKNLKKQKKKIVFTNGCFDLLHVGHIIYLNKAKALGDILIIGLNSDKSVKKLKGLNRPLFPAKERAEILSALQSVDYITIFNEDTPYKIIKKLCPDILVKGGDYNIEHIVGRDFIDSIGGKTVTIPFVKNKSTSNIINKILKSDN